MLKIIFIYVCCITLFSCFNDEVHKNKINYADSEVLNLLNKEEVCNSSRLSYYYLQYGLLPVPSCFNIKYNETDETSFLKIESDPLVSSLAIFVGNKAAYKDSFFIKNYLHEIYEEDVNLDGNIVKILSSYEDAGIGGSEFPLYFAYILESKFYAVIVSVEKNLVQEVLNFYKNSDQIKKRKLRVK